MFTDAKGEEMVFFLRARQGKMLKSDSYSLQDEFKKYAKAWTHALCDNGMDTATARHWLSRAMEKLSFKKS